MGYPDAASVMDGWMNSPGHRANILSANVTQIGVGLAYAADGSPYWTMDFAAVPADRRPRPALDRDTPSVGSGGMPSLRPRWPPPSAAGASGPRTGRPTGRRIVGLVGRRRAAPVGLGRRPHRAAQRACTARSTTRVAGQPVRRRPPLVARRRRSPDGDAMRPAIGAPAGRPRRPLARARSRRRRSRSDSLRLARRRRPTSPPTTVGAGLVAPRDPRRPRHAGRPLGARPRRHGRRRRARRTSPRRCRRSACRRRRRPDDGRRHPRRAGRRRRPPPPRRPRTGGRRCRPARDPAIVGRPLGRSAPSAAPDPA